MNIMNLDKMLKSIDDKVNEIEVEKLNKEKRIAREKMEYVMQIRGLTLRIAECIAIIDKLNSNNLLEWADYSSRRKMFIADGCKHNLGYMEYNLKTFNGESIKALGIKDVWEREFYVDKNGNCFIVSKNKVLSNNVDDLPIEDLKNFVENFPAFYEELSDYMIKNFNVE